MLEAAAKYMILGDIEKYCRIMVELGEWTSALAVAPKVSIEFWASLSSQYADHLARNLSEKCIPYMIASDRTEDAVDFYLSRKEFKNAMVISKVFKDARRKKDFTSWELSTVSEEKTAIRSVDTVNFFLNIAFSQYLLTDVRTRQLDNCTYLD